MALGAGTDFKFTITNAALRVRRVTVNPSVINGHAVGLRKHNAIYPVLHTDITNFTIPRVSLVIRKITSLLCKHLKC